MAHAVTLRSRVPFLHFFDGFRTSHELATIEVLADDDLRALICEDAIGAHRGRRLTPECPVLRGSAQNPDVFFQSREAANPYYLRVPELVDEAFDALAERAAAGGPPLPLVIGGRYGLGSKEFTPAMAQTVLDALGQDRPRPHLTVGIEDDVTHLSLPLPGSAPEPSAPDQRSALFFGLGSDGSVGAAESSAAIIAEHTELFAQGFFEYDSKKSGSGTPSAG